MAGRSSADPRAAPRAEFSTVFAGPPDDEALEMIASLDPTEGLYDRLNLIVDPMDPIGWGVRSHGEEIQHIRM